jgi:dihydrofolate synthase/folylpolyglutamate synthase
VSGREWLDSLGAFGMRLGLENITELLSMLGNPQDSFRTVHIAGTDGKGSTCAMIHSVLCESGCVTGLYTSPHVIRMNERIVVGKEEITDGEIERLADRIRPSAEHMGRSGRVCTFFEVMTAMAFLHFRDRGAAYAVIETGLGGRFDATNTVVPVLSVITHISLEHTAILGDTIEKIAFEKSGIIKAGVPVVTANNGPALEIISRTAEERGSELIRVCAEDVTDITTDGVTTSMRYRGDAYTAGIPGSFQAENAAVAAEASKFLGMAGDDIRNGIRNVRWGSRMERAGDMILDVTHTPAGAAGLAKDIADIYGKVILVFGILDDKDARSVLKALAPVASRIVVTRPDSERAAPVANVKEMASEYHGDVCEAEDVGRAIEEALSSRNGERILVTGSFHMAGDAGKWMKRMYAGS